MNANGTLNTVHIIGNLGHDPELRYTSNGTAICTMSVATSSQRKDGEKNTTWHRVKVFGPRAEACHTYLVKGRKVDVTGSLHASQWEDKEGVTRYTVEIVADNVVFLDGPRQAEPASV